MLQRRYWHTANSGKAIEKTRKRVNLAMRHIVGSIQGFTIRHEPPNECVNTHSSPNHYTLRPIPLNPAIQPGGTEGPPVFRKLSNTS
jgi:hypothetical protein